MFLHRHPFPVVAHFERVVAVTVAFPAATLQPLLAPPLELDAYEGFGFLTVALVWTRSLRPAGFPRFLGQGFFLAGYRVFARMRDDSGRRLRGLKIVRSETDRHRMVFSGNLLTRYRYRPVCVALSEDRGVTSVETFRPDGKRSLRLRFDVTTPATELPVGSPFPDWHTARLFAGPMPFTFSPEKGGTCLVVEGRRDEWTPRPVRVAEWSVALFEEAPLAGVEPVLANAFAVENIDYRWEKGRMVCPPKAA